MVKSRSTREFDVEAFLNSAGSGKSVVSYPSAAAIFSEGDFDQSVMYVQKGLVKLALRSRTRGPAVVGILGAGDFLGEGCLDRQRIRMSSATAITASTVLVIDKRVMVRQLRLHGALSDRFTAYILARNTQLEEDLADHILHKAESRLARVLWRLAHARGQRKRNTVSSMISQEMLAQVIGTTRSRVNQFMKRFKDAGFITYNGGVMINRSLQRVIETL